MRKKKSFPDLILQGFFSFSLLSFFAPSLTLLPFPPFDLLDSVSLLRKKILSSKLCAAVRGFFYPVRESRYRHSEVWRTVRRGTEGVMKTFSAIRAKNIGILESLQCSSIFLIINRVESTTRALWIGLIMNQAAGGKPGSGALCVTMTEKNERETTKRQSDRPFFMLSMPSIHPLS